MSSEKQLRKLVADLVRQCTVVEPQQADEPLGAADTKFGGSPYAERGDAWPICGGCERGLSFIFQWNAAQSPHTAGARGLYAFFYCHECCSWGDVPEDIKGAWALRHYPDPDQAKAVTLKDASPAEARTTECTCIRGKAPSLPDWDGVGELADEVSELSGELNEDEPWGPYSELAEELLGGEPDYRTQIGGYPRFVQGGEFPQCSTCSAKMQLLAQIDSEEEAGVMWGDSGCVYLFGCPKHSAQVEMRLQCF